MQCCGLQFMPGYAIILSNLMKLFMCDGARPEAVVCTGLGQVQDALRIEVEHE